MSSVKSTNGIDWAVWLWLLIRDVGETAKTGYAVRPYWVHEGERPLSLAV